MEKRINKKISLYIQNLKQDVANYVVTHNSGLSKEEIINYINSYSDFTLTSEDFTKRKRIKNIIPHYDRCTAKRADGMQCTRRRKNVELFCGTHNKGQPHGIISTTEIKPTTKKVMVWAEDIKGIIYYLDTENNVYDTTDVINNIKNPKVIAKYEVQEGVYSIPSFGI
jgi:hypothetical protein